MCIFNIFLSLSFFYYRKIQIYKKLKDWSNEPHVYKYILFLFHHFGSIS